MDRIERSKSLTELVTYILRHSIVEGELELGEVLSEAKIASRLEVSRTPVREAFARLEIEGLVTAEPKKNTRVFTLEPKDLDDICDVRCCLEAKALTLAMARRRADLAVALTETTKRMTDAQETGQARVYLRLDTQFHQQIFDHADNVFLNDAYQTVASKIAALRNRLGSHPDHLRKGFAEHLRLGELVAAGDVDQALAVLDAHIARKEGSFWNLNDGLGTPPHRRKGPLLSRR
jgi:DNA-binding GntR family transcriptional regulator